MKQRGHTLVEVIVVLVIVATLSGLIIIRVGQFRAAPPAQQLDRLATLLAGWCELAVLQQRNLGVRISAEGYDFWEPDYATGAAGVRSVSWRESRQEQYAPRLWEGDAAPDLLVSGQITELNLDTPQLRCFASSQMTPFTLRLRQPGQNRQQAVLEAGNTGRLRLQD